jgi:predicted AAA+ superfamily ATPase
MRRRWVEPLIEDARSAFRVVVVNGPRQSGKSTLLGLLAGDAGAEVVTLDDRETLRIARTDPAGFVGGFRHPLFVDEVQRGGDPLVLAIKSWVDRHPDERGQFVLTGSTRFLTVPTLSESLAGRVRLLDMWPFSQGELEGRRDRFLDVAFAEPHALRRGGWPATSRRQAMERIVRGGFPAVQELVADRHREQWFADYQRTLVHRDLSEYRRVRERVDVDLLFRLVASLTAQELNVSKMARAMDVTPDTVRAYLSLFETIYVHHSLPAWSEAFTARVKKRPKLHMVDTGVCAATLGVGVDRLSVPTEPLGGPLLETFVANELSKQRTWSDVRARMYHFRDRQQREVDIVLEAADGRIVGIEVKAAVDIDEYDVRWLQFLRDHLGERFVHGFVIHLGDRTTPWGDRITGIPVSALWSV